MKTFIALLLMALLSSCQTTKTKAKQLTPPTRLDELKATYLAKRLEAVMLRDMLTGWIGSEDCDAMLWTGKYGTTACLGVQIGAAEFEPGRFGRRPEPRCYDEKTKTDQGAKTTWSRDMAIGLFAYAWKCQSISYLVRHRKYGIKNNWIMGKPFDDGRVLYTPQIIGLLHEIIFRLGGDNSPNRALPSYWKKGLTDYQAHLQMMQIWLRHEMQDKISYTMYRRIIEHAEREPHNPFYQYMAGIFTGDQGKTINLLLDPNNPPVSYVRCRDRRVCTIAEWLFTANLVLESFE